MRLVTFTHDGRRRSGVLAGDGIHPLPGGASILDLLRAGGTALRDAAERAIADDAEVLPANLPLDAPVPDPPTMRDFMAFESHFAGALLTRGPDTPVPPQWYERPAFYFSNPYAIVGPADPVPIAPGSFLFDFELEVAAIIGTAGRDLHPDEAEAHIAGYTILIDWSARDLQANEMTVGLGPAKAKDTSTTLGPALVTPDELEPHRSGTSFALAMTASVNGNEIGSDRLDRMAWSFGELIAYASRGTEVRPGDVIGSGTCGGGCLVELWGRRGFDAHPPLQPGDTVEVRVEQLGTLTTTIVAGAEPVPVPRAR